MMTSNNDIGRTASHGPYTITRMSESRVEIKERPADSNATEWDATHGCPDQYDISMRDAARLGFSLEDSSRVFGGLPSDVMPAECGQKRIEDSGEVRMQHVDRIDDNC